MLCCCNALDPLSPEEVAAQEEIKEVQKADGDRSVAETVDSTPPVATSEQIVSGKLALIKNEEINYHAVCTHSFVFFVTLSCSSNHSRRCSSWTNSNSQISHWCPVGNCHCT